MIKINMIIIDNDFICLKINPPPDKKKGKNRLVNYHVGAGRPCLTAAYVTVEL